MPEVLQREALLHQLSQMTHIKNNKKSIPDPFVPGMPCDYYSALLILAALPVL